MFTIMTLVTNGFFSEATVSTEPFDSREAAQRAMAALVREHSALASLAKTAVATVTGDEATVTYAGNDCRVLKFSVIEITPSSPVKWARLSRGVA